MASRPGPEAAKQPQTITLPPPCLTVSMMLKCCWFYARCNGTRIFQKVKLLAHQSTEYLPKVVGIIKMFFGKYEMSLCVIFGQQWCLPWNSPMHAIFAQPLSYCCIMNTDLNWGKWGLQFFRCCSGFFYDILDESSLLSWSSFGKVMGRFTTVPSFLPLWIMALTMVRLSPKTLVMAL